MVLIIKWIKNLIESKFTYSIAVYLMEKKGISEF